MLRDGVPRFKHFGGVSKVKSMFSLLVSTGNYGNELSCRDPDELLQNPRRFEIILFFSMSSAFRHSVLLSTALCHHHYFACVEMFHDRIP